MAEWNGSTNPNYGDPNRPGYEEVWIVDHTPVPFSVKLGVIAVCLIVVLLLCGVAGCIVVAF